MKSDLFQSCGHCWVFQICWHIECSTFIASSFRIWNSSTGIPSPPLAYIIGNGFPWSVLVMWCNKKYKLFPFLGIFYFRKTWIYFNGHVSWKYGKVNQFQTQWIMEWMLELGFFVCFFFFSFFLNSGNQLSVRWVQFYININI